MQKLSPALKFCLNLAKIQAEIGRRFDGRLNGISLNEFIILYHLSRAGSEKMRRVDLADKVGLTASGITRVLLPMEKIGLIKREANAQDARSSFVLLAPGGKSKLEEGLERAELFCEELFPADKTKGIESLSKILFGLGGTIA